MNTLTRRSLLSLSGAVAFVGMTANARSYRVGMPGRPLLSCTGDVGTPEIIRVDSDIPFDRAYIDTTIPYHANALKLAELIGDDLDDDRLTAINAAILEEHPLDIEDLKSMRESWFEHPDPDEATHEMMLISMGGLESCTDESHMDFMDAEWVEKTFKNNDDPLFAYVSMMVLVLGMEQHQHVVGLELADHKELKEFCERMIEVKEPQLATLKIVRGELISRS